MLQAKLLHFLRVLFGDSDYC